ncbi:MAG: polysaccharide lyase [Prevotellaceae bacterium]|jgi:hypothetical protein|nr:polysaccharide lyase [Prevotellaceae bacterium]
MKKVLSLVLVVSCAVAAMAQYPSVPDSIVALRRQWHAAFMQASDSAWKKALPIIQKEAKEGKPYVPWASRPSDLPQADIPAFPGAEGGGMYTFGGRGGQVLTVTNLNNDGEGSLRWACEQGGARIIVFNVSGVINLTSPIVLRAPYVTLAGQTAPGDGICVSGETFWVNTHDVIIRHVRFRRGKTDVGSRDDAIGGNPVGNIIIDHVSTSWGLDENMSLYRHMYDPGDGSKEQKLGTVNITIQNSIFFQTLDTYNHSFGSTLGGENATFMRNIWANNAGRNPSIGWNGQFNFVNNIVYNWVHRSADGGDYTCLYNFINNYYKPGPLTPKDAPIGHRIVKPESGRSKLGYYVFGRVYANGNIMEGNDAVTKDNWAGGVQVQNQKDTEGYTENMRWDKPFPITNTFPIMEAKDAYEFVLNNAGANIPRDIVDQRCMEQVRTGKVHYDPAADTIDFYQFKYRRLPKDSYKQGVITDIRQVGGMPTYKGTPRVDTDKDGMPDEWEKQVGLNPNDAADATKDMNGDGYTNIEKYINGIDPAQKIDWRNPKNNVDVLAKKGKLM